MADDSSDTEREALLPTNNRNSKDENSSDDEYNKRRPKSASSSDYDNSDDFDVDDDPPDEEVDALLASDHGINSISLDEDKDMANSTVGRLNVKENSLADICHSIFNANAESETLESVGKEINITSMCQLVGNVCVNVPLSGLDSNKSLTHRDNEKADHHQLYDVKCRHQPKYVDDRNGERSLSDCDIKQYCEFKANFDNHTVQGSTSQLVDENTIDKRKEEILAMDSQKVLHNTEWQSEEQDPQIKIDNLERCDVSSNSITDGINAWTKQLDPTKEIHHEPIKSEKSVSVATTCSDDIPKLDSDSSKKLLLSASIDSIDKINPIAHSENKLNKYLENCPQLTSSYEECKGQTAGNECIYTFPRSESLGTDGEIKTIEDDYERNTMGENVKQEFQTMGPISDKSDKHCLSFKEHELQKCDDTNNEDITNATTDTFEQNSFRSVSPRSDEQLLSSNDNENEVHINDVNTTYSETNIDTAGEKADALSLNENNDKAEFQSTNSKLNEQDEQLLSFDDRDLGTNLDSFNKIVESSSLVSPDIEQKMLSNEKISVLNENSIKNDSNHNSNGNEVLLSNDIRNLNEIISIECGENEQQSLQMGESEMPSQCNEHLDGVGNFKISGGGDTVDRYKAISRSTNNLFEVTKAKSNENKLQLMHSDQLKTLSKSTNDLFELSARLPKHLFLSTATGTFNIIHQTSKNNVEKQINETLSESTTPQCSLIKTTSEETFFECKNKDIFSSESAKNSLDVCCPAKSDVFLHQELETTELESGYFEKTDSLEASTSQQHLQYDQTISESLRNQLNRFDLLIDTIDQRNARNMATNAAERGYWSTIFGQASEIEDYDDIFAERKAHRALELLEDYHSRLSEPQDRALRIAIERVIRIFKSRLFQALLARDFMLAYKHQSYCISSVVRMLQQLKEENWCLPVMYTACLDLRILAQRCEELGNSSKPGEILEKAADCLMSCFRVCAADNRSSDSETKRLGMLHLVNQLFKVYFRINKLHLCKPLIRAIDSSAFKDMFPLPERITYKYFVGRKAMFDSDYKSADEFLSFAFKHCPKNFPRNKRLILIYLVPVKMLLGFLPKKYILERYDVLQFHELAEALKEGNVRKFDDVIQRHEIFFIKCGIYLLVEKLKFIVYRNLFKKVYIIKQTHLLDLNAFRSALQYVGESDMTIDETHCIVANLIFEGKIKGYISHSHNKLVVSKQNPFPPLNTVS